MSDDTPLELGRRVPDFEDHRGVSFEVEGRARHDAGASAGMAGKVHKALQE